MLINKKQSKLLKEALKDLNNRCSKDEMIKPYLAPFKNGFAQINFELHFKGKITKKGNYLELRSYMES